ncbi:MAG: anthranilate phosphoribosyltransferase [Acidobacteria bacterium]|nr:anthranilate phosphoribosyltransferase [Acidobacteriota bacterium]
MDGARALALLLDGESLSRGQTEALFGALMDGLLSEVHKVALLVALRMKGESVAEIAGAASAMRRRVVAIPHRLEAVVDTCGTGGDGRGTFNVSTAAALVAAGAGVPVAKHGNRSVSSKCGSADVLEALGLDLEESPEGAARALEGVGMAFLFAPKLHPAMREVMPVRRELGVRTVFNVLGPLTNPAGARRQVLGVYAPELVETLARVLAELGSEHALVVHGEGLDELTTTGPTRVAEVKDGEVEVFEVTPEEVGVARTSAEDLAGGDAAHNARLLRGVLEGEEGPLAEITAFNAGAAVYVGGRAPTLAAGVAEARRSLATGAALRKLEELKAFR